MGLILIFIDCILIFFLLKLNIIVSGASLKLFIFLYLSLLIGTFYTLYKKSSKENKKIYKYIPDIKIINIIKDNNISINSISILPNDSFDVYVDIRKNIYISENLLFLESNVVDSLILHEISHIINKDIIVLNILAINSIYILILSLYLIFNLKKLSLSILITFTLYIFYIIKKKQIELINLKQEFRSDLFVLNNNYGKELIQALEFFLDIYKPNYEEDLNSNYFMLISRLKNIKKHLIN